MCVNGLFNFENSLKSRGAIFGEETAGGFRSIGTQFLAGNLFTDTAVWTVSLFPREVTVLARTIFMFNWSCKMCPLSISAIILTLDRRTFRAISLIFEMLSWVFENHGPNPHVVRLQLHYDRRTKSFVPLENTRSRHNSISCTFVDKQNISGADFPSFTRNVQLIRRSIISSGIISTWEIDLNDTHTWNVERTPTKPILFDAVIFVD